MCPNPQIPEDLGTLAEEILNEKLLKSVRLNVMGDLLFLGIG